MSNARAIAATSATLRNLVHTRVNAAAGLAGTQVTVRPPEKARAPGDTSNQLNLALYQVSPNPAWRNRGMGPAGDGPLPLALNLHYLLTAYSEEDELIAQHALAEAMLALHDHSLLGRTEIRDALPDNTLGEQIERVRISPLALNIEDLSKLWTAFQTGYRVAATYEVSVLLIESARPAASPLPVLTRGVADKGAAVHGSAEAVTASLTEIGVEGPSLLPSLGEILTIRGHQLGAPALTVRLSSPRLEQPQLLTGANLLDRTEASFRLRLPPPGAADDLAAAQQSWPAGPYSLAALLVGPDGAVTTNELPMAIAPVLTSIAGQVIGPDTPPVAIARAPGPPPSATIEVAFSPFARPGQRVALLVGGRESAPVPITAPTNTLAFEISGVAAGTYFVRLRVDGVDSQLVDRSVRPPRFRQGPRVQIS